MTANIREALEAAREHIDVLACTFGRTSVTDKVLAEIDAALSAVPAPVSEEEIGAGVRKHCIGLIVKHCTGCADAHTIKAASEITRYLAGLSRTEEEWRPIETAPKDGDDILCWGSALGIIVVQWDADCASSHGGEYPWLTLDGPNYAKDAFTHWMPLPSPPGEQQPDPEESIRTRLDDQHVKSSGGVRTSTLEG